MALLRTTRRWFTARAVRAARAAAPWLPERLIGLAQWWLGFAGPAAPVLSRLVASNMRAAGLYSDAAFREHFAQLAQHFANALRLFRLADRPAEVAALAAAEVDVDGSMARLHEAARLGRGVVVAPAHVCNYLLTLARLNQETPVTVYLRWSEDERKLELKREWCRAAGLRVILEPLTAADPAARAAACVDALRNGHVLVMTPDIAQRRERGAAVRLLGREAYLPTGPASIAMLAEAPLLPVFGRVADGRHVIAVRGPIAVEPLPRAAGGRPEAIRQAMQQWADGFESFLREAPATWFLWADNRWTRVFRGDSRYAGSIPAGKPPTPAGSRSTPSGRDPSRAS